MKKSLLYIHIGTHKTGSTTIQHTLSGNRKELRGEGIVYLGKYKPFAKHIAYAEKTDQNIINRTYDDISTKKEIHSFRKNIRYIISNETFCGDKLTGYKNADRVAAVLHDMFQNLDLDVKIIVYLRRQDDFLESLYTQRIHNGASFTFDQFFQMFDKSAFHWKNLLQAYSNYFGEENMIVRRYGEEFLPQKNSLIQDFGKIINSSLLSDYSTSEILNPGFSNDTLEIARLTNPYLDKGESKKLRILLKSINSKEHYKKYSLFSPKRRIKFMKRFKKSNAEVGQKYFNLSSGRLFSEAKKDPNYRPYYGLTLESATINLAMAIAKVNSKTWKLEKEIEEMKILNRNPIKRKTKSLIWRIINYFPRFKLWLRRWRG